MIPLGVKGRKANIIISANLNSELLNVKCDGLLVSSPPGYSPLGLLRRELERRNDPATLELLDNNCREFDNSEDFIIAGFQLNNQKKILLAPNQNSNYYKSNSPVGNDIWLDFLYASTYYSLALASILGIKTLGITHSFHGIDERFIYCIGDAIGLYSDSYSGNTIKEIIFTGCCFDEDNLSRLFHLNHEGAFSTHREISNEYINYLGMDCLKINLV